MNLFQEFRQLENRRHFLGRGKNLMGHSALASLLGGTSARGLAEALATGESKPGQLPAKAKHIIYLHRCGTGLTRTCPTASAGANASPR